MNLVRFTKLGSNFNDRWTLGIQWPFYVRNYPGYRNQLPCQANLGWKKYRIEVFPEGW